MSARKSLILAMLLLFALSAPVLAASPWIALTSPDPFAVWESRTNSMVPNTEPLTVWQTGRQYMVVWDFVGVEGRVQIDLMKEGKVFQTLSPVGGTAIGHDGKGSQTVIMPTEWISPTPYQIRIFSLATPNISSISEPFSIISKR